MNRHQSISAPVSPLTSPNPSRENSPVHIKTKNEPNFLSKHGMKLLIGTGAAMGYGLNKLYNYYNDKRNQFRSNIKKTKIH